MTEAQIIAAVVPKLATPTKAADPAEALAEKKAQAETLKQQFQPSAPEGKTLKITFSDSTKEDVAKDHEVDMDVGFSPGTPVRAPVASNFDAAAEGVRQAIVDLSPLEQSDIDNVIPAWIEKFGFTSLSVKETGDVWEVTGEMSPGRPVAKLPIPGSESNRFPLDWPKPRSSSYPPLFLAGKIPNGVQTPQSQNSLKKLEGKVDPLTKTVVTKYIPNQKAVLPGGEEIGLDPENRLDEGSEIGPLSNKGTQKGEPLLRVLRAYGFSANLEGREADHVWEAQFGGAHSVGNLWPLDQHINSVAGATLAGAQVVNPLSGKMFKISELKTRKRKYFFFIQKVLF